MTIKMSLKEWTSLGKTAFRNIDPIQYKGWTFEGELDEEEDNRKWLTSIKDPQGKPVNVHFSPYEMDQVGMFKMWVDAGSPSPTEVKPGLTVNTNIMREDLERFILSKQTAANRDELDKILNANIANQKLKFAQFGQREGINPLESPERPQFESEEEYKKWRTSPPFDIPGIAEKIRQFGVKDEKLAGNGMEMVIEHTDGKLYLITIEPLRE